jgi:uncharacterized protein (DUF58 family)
VYLSRRFYILLTLLILLIAAGYLVAPLFNIGRWLLLAFLCLVGIEVVLLYSRKGIQASRHCTDRFSNGDENKVGLQVANRYAFPVSIEVIDEAPIVFQRRDVSFKAKVPINGEQTISYTLRPVSRGIYSFGMVRVFATTVLGLVQRRFTCGEPVEVKVYPSYQMLRQYELMAISNNLQETGIKRIRRVGNHTEFEQIKDYVQGDDYRTINWRATARRHQLMVNVYQDERSQQVYSVIDKGRVMQQAFKGMTLLDYAINASLVLSYVAIRKEDKAGLITFADHFDSFVPASRQSGHMQTLQEALYAQQTVFDETDFSALCAHVNKYVSKRSLLVLYTNFMGVVSLKRQLPFLQQLNRRHRLLVVFFDDMELRDYIHTPEEDTESVFQHVIAEKFVYEKRLIVNMLRQHGILSLLTTPDQLTVQVINRYLEMKKQGLLT